MLYPRCHATHCQKPPQTLPALGELRHIIQLCARQRQGSTPERLGLGVREGKPPQLLPAVLLVPFLATDASSRRRILLFFLDRPGSHPRAAAVPRTAMFRRSNSIEREDTSPLATSPSGYGMTGRRASWSGGPSPGPSPRAQLGAERSLRRRNTSADGELPEQSRSASGSLPFFGTSPSPPLEPVAEGTAFADRSYGSSASSRRQMAAPAPPLLQLPRAQKVPIQFSNSSSDNSNSKAVDSKRAQQMGLLAGAASLVAVYSASTVL